MDNRAEKKKQGKSLKIKGYQTLEHILRGEVLLESFKAGLDKAMEKRIASNYIYTVMNNLPQKQMTLEGLFHL